MISRRCRHCHCGCYTLLSRLILEKRVFRLWLLDVDFYRRYPCTLLLLYCRYLSLLSELWLLLSLFVLIVIVVVVGSIVYCYCCTLLLFKALRAECCRPFVRNTFHLLFACFAQTALLSFLLLLLLLLVLLLLLLLLFLLLLLSLLWLCRLDERSVTLAWFVF